MHGGATVHSPTPYLVEEKLPLSVRLILLDEVVFADVRFRLEDLDALDGGRGRHAENLQKTKKKYDHADV